MSTIPAPQATGPDLGHPAGSPEHRRVLVALFAAGVATFELIYCTQALLPELARDLGVSAGASTLSLSLTTAGLALSLLVLGPVSEAVGRTRLIHLSLAASAVIAVAVALAPSWPALLGLRLLQGVALAGLPAVATAYLREELHPSTHARAAGLYVGGTAIGGMLGRVVTGGIAEVGGWRVGLAGAAAVGLVCAVVVRLVLPPSRHFEPVPISPRGVVAMGRRALGDPALLMLYGIGACSVGALVAVLNAVGFRLAEAPFGLGVGAASLVFLVYPVGSLSSTWAGSLADRLGRRAVLPVGSVVAVGGVLLTSVPSLVVVVLGLALLVAGFFAVHGVASGWVPARAHAGGVATGQAAAFYLFAYYVGSSVFGSAGAQAFTVAGWPAVVAVAGGLLLVVVLLGQGLRRTRALV